MLQVKEMKVPETEEDLPSSDVEQRLNPADKYSQIGESAASCLLDSAVQGLGGAHGCCVVVDLSPRTGDFARAVLKTQTASLALHYLALAPESQFEWAQQDLLDLAVDLFLAHSLKLKDIKPLPEKADDQQQQDLVTPQLNCGSVDGVNLILPQTLIAKWESSSFKEEWQALLEELKHVIPEKDLGNRPSKRARVADVSDGPPPGVSFIPTSDLDMTKLLLQVKGVNKLKGLTWQIYPDNRIVLLNTTAADIAVTGVLTSWQKGKWWQPKEVGEGFDLALDVVWKFSSSSEMVQIDNTAKTLCSVMEDMKAEKPEKAILRYHIMTANPNGPLGPGDFNPEVKHQVAWRAERVAVEGEKTNPMALAALIPVDAWDLSRVQIVFTCRWAKQGLTGIKPSVWLRRSCVIPPQMAIQLTLTGTAS